MFSSNQLNHGVASLQFDEAALLYRLARDATSGPFAEIGRFKGGSTIVFATALPEGVELWSYDLHVALRPDMPGEQLDGELSAALERFGLDAQGAPRRRRLAHGRSAGRSRSSCCSSTATTATKVRRRDFERWQAFVRPDGHVLFHDAVDTGGYGNVYPGVARLVGEIERGGGWRRLAGAGSIAHFTRAS